MLCPFRQIAGFTRQREIREPVSPSSRARLDVFDLQRKILPITVRALPVPPLQEEFSEFLACKVTLLVLDILYARTLHRLRVELHQFLRERSSERLLRGWGSRFCRKRLSCLLDYWQFRSNLLFPKIRRGGAPKGKPFRN